MIQRIFAESLLRGLSFSFTGTGYLGVQELGAAADAREHRHKEDDDPHAAEPLRHAPPQENAARQTFYLSEHSDPCGCEARECLKKSVEIAWENSRS